MTTKEKETSENLERLSENLARIETLSQRMVEALSRKKAVNPGLEAPGQDLFARAASTYLTEAASNPAKIFEKQVEYWGQALKLYTDAQQNFAAVKSDTHQDEKSIDSRFADPLWDQHPFFSLVKQQYQMSSDVIADAVASLEGMEEKDRKRLKYFTQQIVDMMSPANFLATNPTALAKAVETEGQSLVDGLENLVRDIEANDGDLIVTLADKDSFRVGDNLATTEGSVVYRNEIFELIQYAPTTKTVHKTPLVIFPPWINKFYILDLKEKNSLIKWIVDQGFTLFVVSWKNPNASYRDFALDDYVEKGYLTAIEKVKAITGEKQINAVGYCIAGTTLSLTIALMKKRGDKSLKSATFFTTLTDFEDQGEVGVFLSNDFVDSIEDEVNREGYLDRKIMSRTFSFLRSNDLIYGPAIRSYMLGEAPPAFDLLYWNGDGTNLPARMAVQYLRGLCQDNRFARGGIEILGENLQLSDVSIPICAIACETDHIADWRSSYAGIQQMGSRSKSFILSESGHIAGIINPPSKKKYGHYSNENSNLTSADWQEGAEFHEGSWWPRWCAWLASRSGKQVVARRPGDVSDYPILCVSPGIYVTETPKST